VNVATSTSYGNSTSVANTPTLAGQWGFVAVNPYFQNATHSHSAGWTELITPNSGLAGRLICGLTLLSGLTTFDASSDDTAGGQPPPYSWSDAFAIFSAPPTSIIQTNTANSTSVAFLGNTQASNRVLVVLSGDTAPSSVTVGDSQAGANSYTQIAFVKNSGYVAVFISNSLTAAAADTITAVYVGGGGTQEIAIFEVPAFPAVVGSISGNAGIAGATVSYTGPSSGSVTADGSGNYTISGLSDGSYTVTPSLSFSTFSPVDRVVAVSGADVTGINFTAIGTEAFISEVQVTVTYQNPGNYLYARDLNSWGDGGVYGANNGQPYGICNIVLGSITLSQPGAPMFPLQHVVGYFNAVGTLDNGGPSKPDIWILPNEISDTAGIGFIQLPEVLQEPPMGQNHPSKSLLALRYPVNMMNSQLASQFIHHLQVKIQFEPENAANTIKAISFKESQD